MRTSRFDFMTLSVKHENDILFAEFPAPLHVDLETAKQIVEERIKFMGETSHYLIGDFANIHHVSADAREYMQSEDGGLKNILGAAFIASSPLTMLLANIFIKSPKNFPARFFSDKEHALEWIRLCKAANEQSILTTRK